MNLIKTTLVASLCMSAAMITHAQKAPATEGNPQVVPTPPPSAVTASAARQAGGEADEIVEMSVFNVTASEETSYFADKTFSSGRLATGLTDIAANVDVITKAQLEDMGAVDLADLLGFSTSTQIDLGDFGAETINAIAFEGTGRANIIGRARGLPLTRTVDYETVDWEVDQFNVERADTFLGTDAVLFGNGNPGGVVNYTKDQASLRSNWLRTWYRFGSNAESRFQLDVQSAIIRNKLGIRFEMLDYDSENFRKFYYRKRNAQYVALAFRPYDGTLFHITYEHGKNQRQQALINLPSDQVSKWWYIDDPAKFRETFDNSLGTANFNPAAGVVYYGGRNSVPNSYPLGEGRNIQTQGLLPAPGEMPLDIFDYHKYSYAGPDSRYFQEYRDFRITLEQRLARNVNLRAYYRTSNSDQNSRFIRRNAPNPGFFADPLPSTGEDDPYSGRVYTWSNWRYEKTNSKNEAFSATLAWTPNFGKWWGRHNVSLTYDDRLTRFTRYRYQERVYSLDGDGNAVGGRDLRRVNYMDPNDDSTWHLGYWSPIAPFEDQGTTYYTGFVPVGDADFGNSTVDRLSRWSMTAYMQSYWLDHRLVTSIGYRRDDTDNLVLDPQYMPPGMEVPSGISATTRLDYFDPVQRDPRMKIRQETMSFSGVLHLNKAQNVSLFLGRSGNVGNRIGNRVLPDTEPPSNPERADSLDYGVRFNFFKGKLAIRAGAYKTSQRDSYAVMNNNFWYLFTRAGGTAYNNPPAFEIPIALPDGGYAFETYTATAHALDTWADLIAANGLITPAQKAVYDKQLGRVPSGAQGNIGVSAMQIENKAEGYEMSIHFQPFRNTSIKINYAYNKTNNENIAADVSAWLDEFFGYVVQLPDSVLDARFDMTKLNTNLAENRPSGSNPYSNWQVFLANYASLFSKIDDIVSDRSTEFGNRRHKLNIYFRQNIPKGFFKGLRFGGGYTFESGTVQARLRTLSEDGTSLITNTIMGPSIWNANAFAAYTFNTRIFGARVRMTAQLNVQNLFNNDYELQILRVRTESTSVPGVGFEIKPVLNPDGNTTIPTRWNYAEPRTIYLRLGIEF